ncbi:diguanylate cyclase [Limibacillus halophilus]
MADLLVRAFGIGFFFGISAYGGIVLTENAGSIASIWLSNGFLLAVLLRSQTQRWPVYVAAAVIANVTVNLVTGSGATIAIGLSLCNAFEVLVAAYPLRYLLGPRFSLDRGESFAGFMAFAVLFAPAATSVIAAAFLQASAGASFVEVVGIWFPADALGMAIMAPPILALHKRDVLGLLEKSKRLRTLGVLALLLAVSLLIFSGQEAHIAFVIYLPLVVAVIHLGFAGGSLAILMVGGIALAYTFQDAGPFSLHLQHGPREQILLLQGFVACAILIALPLAVILNHRQRLTLDLERANRKLAEIATTDALTGLANRRLFDRSLMMEWRRAQRSGEPLSVLVLDIDNFKAYNDLYGHLKGDECLKMVAGICNGRLRRAGDLFARFGGEEFMVVLPNTPLEGARHVAERMRLAVELAQIEHKLDPNGRVTVCIGVACLSGGQPEDAESLLEAADRALYRAKKNGRNRVECAGAPAASKPKPSGPRIVVG